MTTITGEQTKMFQLVVLKSALRLEIIGMRHSSGRRASVQIRKLLANAGIKPARDLRALADQYGQWLESQS